MKSERSTHAAVEKALRILKAFTPHNEGMGTVELSKKLKIHKSTMSRLLKALEKHGFLEQDRETKKYGLGRSAVSIGRAVTRSLETRLVSIAKPHIDDLGERLKETVGLEVWTGNSTILAYASYGPQLVQVSASVGTRMPVHVAAGARAIMAFLPPEVVGTLLDRELRPFTPTTITDPELLKKKLKEIARKGFSLDLGELDEDVHILGVPVFDHTKRPVAAVVMAAPAFRMKSLKAGKVTSLMKETAAKISERLYYSYEEE